MTSANASLVKFFTTIGIGLIILCFLFRGCICHHPSNPIPAPIVKTDTIWRTQKTDTFYQPVPYQVKVSVPKPYKVHDTLETTEYIPVDSAAILKDYLSTAYYKDTARVEYGYIVINDEVTKNRISSRKVITNINTPITTKTITLAKPKRTVLYFNVGLFGDKTTPLFGVESGFSLKLKNDKIWGAKAMLYDKGNLLYGLTLGIPIKLHK